MSVQSAECNRKKICFRANIKFYIRQEEEFFAYFDFFVRLRNFLSSLLLFMYLILLALWEIDVVEQVFSNEQKAQALEKVFRNM